MWRRVAELDDVQPLERRHGGVEPGGAVLGLQPLKPFPLRRLVEIRQVVVVDRQCDVPVRDLQRLVQALPVERAAQHGVRGDDRLPAADERVHVQRTLDGVGVLAEVHVGGAVVQAVQQHALLKR